MGEVFDTRLETFFGSVNNDYFVAYRSIPL